MVSVTIGVMDLAFVAPLALLALIDSTSFGTLLIPVLLLTMPGRIRVGRMLLYLATVAVFYLVVGMLLVLGVGAVWEPVTDFLDRPIGLGMLFVLGAGLLVGSFFIDSKRARARREARGGGRFSRWRERAIGTESGSPVGLMVLALGAAGLEVATMLPYLAAIGMITAAGFSLPATTATLAGYCVVMVLPALALLAVRVLAGSAVEGGLRRFGDWMAKHAASTTAWVVGIVGFLLARDAGVRLAAELGLFSAGG